MHPARLLDLCTELLGPVLQGAQPADRVVSAFFRQHRDLGQRERHTLAETAYELLRRRLLWQHLAQGAGGPLNRRLAVLAWQGSRDFLRRALSPEEAAWADRVAAIDAASLPEPQRHNLPGWLATALRESLPEAEFWPLAGALNQGAPLDLRVNTVKARREQAQAALQAEGIESQPTAFSPWGLRVQGKPALERTAAFRDGWVEVQDEGSQLLALLTGAGRGEMVADFCAGAGGKTLALGAMMRNTGRLYAFDTSGHRLDALKPRLARSGLSNVYPAQIAHERDDRVRRLAGKIDRVLVDAPCTGLGTLRRNPDLKWRQGPQAVGELAERQLAILSAASRLLRPGGRLVYATCSLLREENEAVVAAFEAQDARAWERAPAAGLLAAAQVTQDLGLDDSGFLRLWPHRHGTDGFFAAAWTRR